MKLSETARQYLLFMIDKKEVTGSGYKNRKAADFYRHLRQNATMYKCSIADVVEDNAALVMDGKYISLIG